MYRTDAELRTEDGKTFSKIDVNCATHEYELHIAGDGALLGKEVEDCPRLTGRDTHSRTMNGGYAVGLRLLCVVPVVVTALAAAPLAAQQRWFTDVIFVDHQNLRHVEDEDVTRHQAGLVRKNLDQAAELGVNAYLLFAKETMEAMLSYDFEVAGIGNIGEKAFPSQSQRRRRTAYLRDALADVLKYAKQKNIRLFFHSNQFIFPDEVLEVIKPTTRACRTKTRRTTSRMLRMTAS